MADRLAASRKQVGSWDARRILARRLIARTLAGVNRPGPAGCLTETGVLARDVDVGVAWVEGDSNELDSAAEATAIGRWEAGEECFASAGNFVEGGEGVANHRGKVESVGSAVEDDECLRAVGVEVHDRSQMGWLVLGDKERIDGAEQGQEVESRSLESSTHPWSDVFLDGVGYFARGTVGSARHAYDGRESGRGRQEKRTVMRREASSQDGRAATTRR